MLLFTKGSVLDLLLLLLYKLYISFPVLTRLALFRFGYSCFNNCFAFAIWKKKKYSDSLELKLCNVSNKSIKYVHTIILHFSGTLFCPYIVLNKTKKNQVFSVYWLNTFVDSSITRQGQSIVLQSVLKQKKIVTVITKRYPESREQISISLCKHRAGWPRHIRCPRRWCRPGSSGRPFPWPVGDGNGGQTMGLV